MVFINTGLHRMADSDDYENTPGIYTDGAVAG